jgi:hypothetical protein
MISSGVISVRMGILPEMNTTDPYSPRARAKAMAKPVNRAGTSWGKITRRRVCQRVAPRLAEASSNSGSSSSIMGCRVRTTKGRPMKVSATKIPISVNAIFTP